MIRCGGGSMVRCRCGSVVRCGCGSMVRSWVGSFVRSGVGVNSLVWANFSFVFDISVVLFVLINIIIYDSGTTD